jgi:hypothetical protein
MSLTDHVGVSIGFDGIICVWDFSTPNAIRCKSQLETPYNNVCVSIDGAGCVAATGCDDGCIRVWDIRKQMTITSDCWSEFIKTYFSKIRPQRSMKRIIPFVCFILGLNDPLMNKKEIYRVGDSCRVSFSRKADLMWENSLIRKWVFYPMLAIVAFIWIFTSSQMLGVSIFSAVIIWLGLNAADIKYSLFKYKPIRLTLVYLRKLKLFHMAFTFPVLKIFRVLHCPICGEQICGRRNLFYCHHCGFVA